MSVFSHLEFNSHCQVESMHWMLDMSLREYGPRIRKKQSIKLEF